MVEWNLENLTEHIGHPAPRGAWLPVETSPHWAGVQLSV